MASEDCIEVFFVGLVVVGRNYVLYLVIVVIFMRFGKQEQKCGDALKSSIGAAMQAKNRGSF